MVAEGFGAKSTTDDVLSGVNLRGKRIPVTGASAGLGVETARSLRGTSGACRGRGAGFDQSRSGGRTSTKRRCVREYAIAAATAEAL